MLSGVLRFEFNESIALLSLQQTLKISLTLFRSDEIAIALIGRAGAAPRQHDKANGAEERGTGELLSNETPGRN